MKKQLKQLVIAFFVVIGVLSVVCTVPKVNALTVDFRDENWTVIVTGPDMVKPGNVESYTIDGTLSPAGDVGREGVDVTFTVDTASELSKLLLEATPSDYPGIYPYGYHFSKTYNITIPNDAINNTFVGVYVTSGYEYAGAAVSWVQDPTYSSLQDQISSLNSTLAILQSTYSGSASEIMSLRSLVLTLQSEKANLQSEKANLQSEKANLQTQLNATQCSLDDANTKLSSSNYSMYGAFLTAIVFIIVSVVLAVLLAKKRITVKEKGTQ